MTQLPTQTGLTAEELPVTRRTVLKSTAVLTGAGVIGVPSVTGAAFADDHSAVSTCGKLDVYCILDTSGSLNASEVSGLETAVNAFIGQLPTDGSVTVGSLEFGNAGIRNRNPLQNPGSLTVSVSSPRGNTPMAGALDIADQAVYGDSNARSDAVKLLVLFTDGGPNYEPDAAYAATYSAPRDTTGDWSAVSGNATYDNGDTASATVTAGEMEETALVAGSIKGTAGAGETTIATVYVGNDDDTQAMTAGAISAYTNLPTFLEAHVASNSALALTTTLDDIAALVEQLLAIIGDPELCDCVPCDVDGLLAKYEFACVETVEDECVAWDFVLEEGDGTAVTYEMGNYETKDGEDVEPVSATFGTAYCTVYALVKAGQELVVQELVADDGQVTARAVDPYAISFVAFYCTAEAAQDAADAFPSNGKGGGNRGGGNEGDGDGDDGQLGPQDARGRGNRRNREGRGNKRNRDGRGEGEETADDTGRGKGHGRRD